MKSNALTIGYWVAIVLFGLAMLADGIAGLLQAEAGQEALTHLGYPLYLMTITGAAKVLGALAVLQNRFHAVKEWAFAGFVITCLGAFASRYIVGDPPGLVVLPLVFLAITLGVYYLWKRHDAGA